MRRPGVVVLGLIFLSLSVGCQAYLPVVFMHGIFSDGSIWGDLIDRIEAEHPGTKVYPLDIYDHLEGFTPMWEQVEGFKSAIQSFNFTTKYNVVTHSQGGALVRAALETWPEHNIENWVSLSGPLLGVFGDTEFVEWFLPHKLPHEISKILYTKEWQDNFSVANYWKDPLDISSYLKYVDFIPVLDGESDPEHMPAYRDNFLKLNKMVLVGGKDDGIIIPYESALWRFYRENDSSYTVEPMENQTIYKEDTFGLRTMIDDGRAVFFDIPGVYHTHWYRTESVITNCIMPYLS